MKRTLGLIVSVIACTMLAACGSAADYGGPGNAVAHATGGGSDMTTAAVAGVAGYALAKATQPSAGQQAVHVVERERTRYVPVYASRRHGQTPSTRSSFFGSGSSSKPSFTASRSSFSRSSYRFRR